MAAAAAMLTLLLAGCAAPWNSSATSARQGTPGTGEPDGNRYAFERFYAGEISAAGAYLQAVLPLQQAPVPGVANPEQLVIVDVRDATEYAAGHPQGAFHLPYPRVYQVCKPRPAPAASTKAGASATADAADSAAPDATALRTPDGGTCLYGSVPKSAVTMSDEQLFRSFEARFADKSQRVALLCRTGSRSVRAANVLSNPEKYLGSAYAGRGYRRILNIWEGFVGQPIAPIHSATGRVIGAKNDVEAVTLDNGVDSWGFKAAALDVNRDGKLTIADSDGWRYHQALPYVRTMEPALLLSPAARPYYEAP